jgi:hypothetical protein
VRRRVGGVEGPVRLNELFHELSNGMNGKFDVVS